MFLSCYKYEAKCALCLHSFLPTLFQLPAETWESISVVNTWLFYHQITVSLCYSDRLKCKPPVCAKHTYKHRDIKPPLLLHFCVLVCESGFGSECWRNQHHSLQLNTDNNDVDFLLISILHLHLYLLLSLISWHDDGTMPGCPGSSARLHVVDVGKDQEISRLGSQCQCLS